MEAERIREEQTEKSLRAAIGLYGQSLAGLCLFAVQRVGTPAWLSMLLTLPFFLLCALWARRVPPPASLPGRMALSAALWLDALAAYAVFCVLCRSLLQAFSPWAIALGAAAFAFFAIRQDRALTILARLMAALILVSLLCCALSALPHGNVSRLFPLLGRGAPAWMGGALWLCGCTATACWPWLDRRADDGAARPPLAPPAAAIALGVLTAALYALLLPYRALEGDAPLAEKLTVLSRFSGIAVIWPLWIAALLLLLFYALSSALSRSVRLLTRGRQRASLAGVGMLLALLPFGALHTRAASSLLLALIPCRSALVLALLAALSLKKAFRKGGSKRA